jgi:hypothetical protein
MAEREILDVKREISVNPPEFKPQPSNLEQVSLDSIG